MSTELGWLIERSYGTRTLWWCGGAAWTADSLEAVRFARSVDAELVKESLDGTGGLRVTEHTWIGSSTPDDKCI